MKYITTDSQLKSLLPNQIQVVQGEPSLYEKLSSFLETSENWAINTFLGDTEPEDFFTSIIRKVIAYDALFNALPCLDLVLTPNGFGIVSNQNIAPASKERIERLIANCEKNRDINIEALLRSLPACDEWLNSDIGKHFRSTLYPRPYLTITLGGTEHVWQKYQEYIPVIAGIERDIEEAMFSPELMEVLRLQSQLNSFSSDLHSKLCKGIRYFIENKLKGNCLHPQYLADLLNIVRNNKDTFPEWHASTTAELFSSEVYENKKESSGYFF